MKKIIKKIFIAAVVLIVLLVGLSLFGSSLNKNDYSENQNRVISNFGLPQIFTIAIEDESILEYWKYIFLDEIFIFENGVFIARQLL